MHVPILKHYLCATVQKPTVLAKMLGVFRIGYKNAQTITEHREDVLVMENLFYGRNISQVRMDPLSFCKYIDLLFMFNLVISNIIEFLCSVLCIIMLLKYSGSQYKDS